VTVQRHITEEETVAFEGLYPTNGDALVAASAQLALCRDHMARYNAEVRLLDQTKADELTATITAKGEELKDISSQLTTAREQLGKATKRLQATG